MTYITNIIAAPLILAVWALDAYLFMVSVRLVAGQVSGAKPSTWYQGLRQVVDGAPRAVERWLAKQPLESSPTWLPWVIVVVASVLLRQILVCLAVSVG